MRRHLFVGALCALAAAVMLGLAETSLSAWGQTSCDFLTGGGFIYPFAAGKGTFGVGGGCKNGSGLGTPPAPYWGHLEYDDHDMGVKVHAVQITGYMIDAVLFPDPYARLICGTGKTDDGDVTFIVRAKDGGEGRYKDEFDIQVQGATVYTTFAGAPHKLGGGRIQLHKPNKSNTGKFGGSCPGLPTPGPPSPETSDVSVNKSTTTPSVAPGVGTTVSYDLLVHNAGPAIATGVVVTDHLPIATSVTSWVIAPGVAGCMIDATQTLKCDFATLASGANIAIHVEAAADCPLTPTGESLMNQATIVATNEGTAVSNNASDIVTIIVQACGE